MAYERDPNEIGAIWGPKQTSKGDDYFSGTINGVKVMIFKNRKKNSDNQPDFRVVKADKQPEQQG